MKRTLLAIAASVALVGALETPAHSATFSPIAGGHSLVMTGDVMDGDAERLATAYVESYEKRGFAPERIFLNSDGGSVLAGLKVASVIERSGMHTVIGRDDECYSICVTIFAAGSHRVVFPTSIMGVHRAGMQITNANGDVSEDEDDTTRSITLALANLMREYGAPASLIIKMISTKPGEITYLTLDDLAGWVELIP